MYRPKGRRLLPRTRRLSVCLCVSPPDIFYCQLSEEEVCSLVRWTLKRLPSCHCFMCSVICRLFGIFAFVFLLHLSVYLYFVYEINDNEGLRLWTQNLQQVCRLILAENCLA